MLFGCFFLFVYIIGEALKNKIYNKPLPSFLLCMEVGKKSIIFFQDEGGAEHYLTYPYISPCKARKKTYFVLPPCLPSFLPNPALQGREKKALPYFRTAFVGTCFPRISPALQEGAAVVFAGSPSEGTRSRQEKGALHGSRQRFSVLPTYFLLLRSRHVKQVGVSKRCKKDG